MGIIMGRCILQLLFNEYGRGKSRYDDVHTNFSHVVPFVIQLIINFIFIPFSGQGGMLLYVDVCNILVLKYGVVLSDMTQ